VLVAKVSLNIIGTESISMLTANKNLVFSIVDNVEIHGIGVCDVT
jgi:hypothetical protein